jgi:hypothetical protein
MADAWRDVGAALNHAGRCTDGARGDSPGFPRRSANNVQNLDAAPFAIGAQGLPDVHSEGVRLDGLAYDREVADPPPGLTTSRTRPLLLAGTTVLLGAGDENRTRTVSLGS